MESGKDKCFLPSLPFLSEVEGLFHSRFFITSFRHCTEHSEVMTLCYSLFTILRLTIPNLLGGVVK